MRLASLILLCACSGSPAAMDVRPPDAGDTLTCEPGVAFCADGDAWECTLSGHDAYLSNRCYRAESPGEPAAQGHCADAPCGGQSLNADGGGPFCCYP